MSSGTMSPPSLRRRFASLTFSSFDWRSTKPLPLALPVSVTSVPVETPPVPAFSPMIPPKGPGSEHEAKTNGRRESAVFFIGRIISRFAKTREKTNACAVDVPRGLRIIRRPHGEMAERSIATVLKTVVSKDTQGSNPCLSAIERHENPHGNGGFFNHTIRDFRNSKPPSFGRVFVFSEVRVSSACNCPGPESLG